MPSHRREGDGGRRHRSDGYCDGCDRLHAPQELTLGSCWSYCGHIGTQHERPRGHCAREGAQWD
jgi:hypothetical protein